jgi:hypothetical protein
MRLEESSLYGKVIIPWYDADGILIATIVVMVMVVLFGLVGLVVAIQDPAFHPDTWVPATLVAGGLLVVATATLRLWRRRRLRRQPP